MTLTESQSNKHNQIQEMAEEKAKNSSEDKPKPCCVCKPEKAERDSCLLFNGQESGKCDEFIKKYKNCMKGFGFETN